ncbi:MAG TPA: Calx-beta domain-containing protein [Ilumatobacteraceae bacterium]
MTIGAVAIVVTCTACSGSTGITVVSSDADATATTSLATTASTITTEATTTSSAGTVSTTAAPTPTTVTTTPTPTTVGPVEETISTSDTIASEADGFADTTVTLNAPAATVITVSYTVNNQTAVNGPQFDYVGLVGFLTFAPGETSKVIHTQVIDDSVAEPLETFLYTLFQPVGATISVPTAQVTIIDNDTIVDVPPLYVFNTTVDEKAGVATVNVLLGGPNGRSTTTQVSANYRTVSGSATEGSDFNTTAGTVSFSPGDTAQTVQIPIIDDTDKEGAETFTVEFSKPIGATIAGGAPIMSATVTIGASDALVSANPLVSGADATVSEADGFADVVVTLGAPSAKPVNLNYTVENQTATNGGSFDYVGRVAYLTFAPGETTKVIETQLVDDITAEPLETFQYQFISVTGATIATPFATVTINDDD